MKNALWIRLAFVAGIAAIASPAVASPPVGTISPVTGNLSKTNCINPEGITVDLWGNLYTGSAALVPTTHICKFDHNGAFVKSVDIPAGPGGIAPLLGVHFAAPHTIIALDFANTLKSPPASFANNQGRVLSVNMETGVVTPIASGFAFPNGVAEDLLGRLYVTDSFHGTITRMNQDGSNLTVWSADPLLAGNKSIPGLPIGANGIAFDTFFQYVYVSNTSNRRVVRFKVEQGWTAGAAEIFADGVTIDGATGTALKGADGITFDLFGNLYVAANAANEIQVLSHSGQLTARYSNGSLPMDTTATPIFWGNQLFFTNLSLQDGGINSSVAVLQAPLPGLPPL
jgi:sugar lactone lactonase YvrE